jgi:hypothetical protein
VIQYCLKMGKNKYAIKNIVRSYNNRLGVVGDAYTRSEVKGVWVDWAREAYFTPMFWIFVGIMKPPEPHYL